MAGAIAGGLCAALLVLVSFLPWCSAAGFTVGGNTGWTNGYDYSTWTSGKTFAAGDTLTFNYAPGVHNVAEVSATDYGSCSAANPIFTDSSGATTITLKTAGPHYFICGVPGHCAGGMKVSVTVGGGAAPATPNSPMTPPGNTTPAAPSSPTTPPGSNAPGNTTTPVTTAAPSSSGGLVPPAALLLAGLALLKCALF